MLGPFRYVLLVTSITVVILLISPLIILMRDFATNTSCLSISVDTGGLRVLDNNTYRVSLIISYCSYIKLRDFKVNLSATSISIPELDKGEKRIEISLDVNEVPSINYIEFKVLGLYKIVIKTG
ncbi:MAG: hypothetical protein ACP5N5_05135 [Desulfurococcus sp.]|uniref:hypothetical protein n=1 Tax=Desulfurococcus sp. TaxID=51678 RepID=UPI003D1270EC